MATLDDIRTLIETGLANLDRKIEREIGDLKKTTPNTAEARRAELDREKTWRQESRDHNRRAEMEWTNNVNTEIQALEEGTWTGPTFDKNRGRASAPQIYVNVQQPAGTGGTHSERKPQLKTQILPKFCYGDNLFDWIVKMDHLVTRYGEKTVCPEVYLSCFKDGDAIQLWYQDLGSMTHTMCTDIDGCWNNLRSIMVKTWSKTVGQAQSEADMRTKQANESWTEYCISKIHLCRAAYPDADDENILSKVRAKFPFDLELYCKETTEINRFVTEIQNFDRIAERQRPAFPPRNDRRGPVYMTGASQAAEPYRANYSRATTVSSSSTLDNSQERNTRQRNTPRPQTSGQRSAVERRATVQDRMNPATRTMTRSFINRAGKTIFLERPCDNCKAVGKNNKMHFRFECTEHMPQVNTFLSEVDQRDLPGTSPSPVTGLPTSHIFSGDPSAYLSNLAAFMDNGLSSDDEEGDESGNESGGQ
jgi:hypothetical protein